MNPVYRKRDADYREELIVRLAKLAPTVDVRDAVWRMPLAKVVRELRRLEKRAS